MKIKPLKFVDEPRNYYGLTPRSTAVVDTWNEDTDPAHPRIYHRFDVYRDNHDNLHAMSSSLGLGPVAVETFVAGEALCENWHQEYWTQLLADIKENILENEE